MQIKSLDDELGGMLRDRAKKPVIPTEAGEAVLAQARETLREYNSIKEVVARIKEGLKRTGGYCPCRLARTEENKCMCEEFRNQIKDPDFEGYCHCMLYYKEK